MEDTEGLNLSSDDQLKQTAFRLYMGEVQEVIKCFRGCIWLRSRISTMIIADMLGD